MNHINKNFFIILMTLLLLSGSLVKYVFASPVTFTDDTILNLVGPGINVTVLSGSVADLVTVNAGNIVVDMSASTGGTFTMTSPQVMTVTGGSITQSCSSGIETETITQASGSTTYTLTPTGSVCTTTTSVVSSSGRGSSGSRSGSKYSPPSNVASLPNVSVFSIGNRSLYLNLEGVDVIQLQTFLVSKGYLSQKYITGFFGPLTEQAVKQFQIDTKIISLPANYKIGYGIVGPITQSVINSLSGGSQMTVSQPALTSVATGFTRNLMVGSVGEDVKQLQIFLNSKGFFIARSGPGSLGNETTRFGVLTKNALMKFQASVGISPASGYFGSITRAFILQ